MNKELLEKSVEMENTSEKNNYQRYLELGGIINEEDYDHALERIGTYHLLSLSESQILQAENIAKFAGIELQSTDGIPDPRIILYGILRSDTRPEGVKHHHSEMRDQKIFMEALRMLGDAESAEKMIKKYTNINFIYQREDQRKEKAAI